MLTEIGSVEIEAPRDFSTFDSQIVKKRQRRVTGIGIGESVLLLTATGLTAGDVAAHFADVYGAASTALGLTSNCRHSASVTETVRSDRRHGLGGGTPGRLFALGES